MLTSLFLILYKIDNLALFLLSSNDTQFSCSNISLTEDMLLYRFVAYLADLRCTMSSLCLSFMPVATYEATEEAASVRIFASTASVRKNLN